MTRLRHITAETGAGRRIRACARTRFVPSCSRRVGHPPPGQGAPGHDTVPLSFRFGVVGVSWPVSWVSARRIMGLDPPRHHDTNSHTHVHAHVPACACTHAYGVVVSWCRAFFYPFDLKEKKEGKATTPATTPAARACRGLPNHLKSLEKGGF